MVPRIQFERFLSFQKERRDIMFQEEKYLEEQYLGKTVKLLNEKIEGMEHSIFKDAEKIAEFKKYMWENKNAMDKQELNSVRTNSEQEALLLLRERDYFKKLMRIQQSPYFASIVVLNELKKQETIYIGMTYLKDEHLDNLIYDWRAPISSIFYDNETGLVQYETPSGIIQSELFRKRQYKITKQKLERIIDSNINIDDDVLQEVLAQESSDKMKNIVTTIQQEQNAVIRNVRDKNLIVQGIAGSGKTSVALHRIAFLLYKIKNLTSEKILIFSPNQIFTEYISNVLPELGEDNTVQTTFHDYLNKIIAEYKSVESYIDFLKRYYMHDQSDLELIKYKQSNEIIRDIEDFVLHFQKTTRFQTGFVENHVFEYSKEQLNYLLTQKYNHLPFFTGISLMAQKLSEINYNGSSKKKSTYHRLLLEALGMKKDYRALLLSFYQSDFFKKEITETQQKKVLNNKSIAYEDALIFVYLKGLMEGFHYDKYLEQVVIDEAQDYSYLQYLILNKIFKKASFTILGDVNQTINPYYKYDSLEELKTIWDSRYLELSKTYRSSEEIIEYANKVLSLDHVCAIRKTQNCPVLFRTKKDDIKKDILYLKNKYQSLAIITHDETASLKLYENLKEQFEVSFVGADTTEFKKDFIIIPAYLAKGLEFDSVIIYETEESIFKNTEKNLYYVAITRAQHELIVYQNK